MLTASITVLSELHVWGSGISKFFTSNVISPGVLSLNIAHVDFPPGKKLKVLGEVLRINKKSENLWNIAVKLMRTDYEGRHYISQLIEDGFLEDNT